MNDSDNSELSTNDKTEDINNNKKILYPKEYKNELTNEDFIHLKLDNKKQNIKNKEKTIKNEHKEKNENYNQTQKKMNQKMQKIQIKNPQLKKYLKIA